MKNFTIITAALLVIVISIGVLWSQLFTTATVPEVSDQVNYPIVSIATIISQRVRWADESVRIMISITTTPGAYLSKITYTNNGSEPRYMYNATDPIFSDVNTLLRDNLHRVVVSFRPVVADNVVAITVTDSTGAESTQYITAYNTALFVSLPLYYCDVELWGEYDTGVVWVEAILPTVHFSTNTLSIRPANRNLERDEFNEIQAAVAAIGGEIISAGRSYSWFDILVPENTQEGLVSLSETLMNDNRGMFSRVNLRILGQSGVPDLRSLNDTPTQTNTTPSSELGGGEPPPYFRTNTVSQTENNPPY